MTHGIREQHDLLYFFYTILYFSESSSLFGMHELIKCVCVCSVCLLVVCVVACVCVSVLLYYPFIIYYIKFRVCLVLDLSNRLVVVVLFALLSRMNTQQKYDKRFPPVCRSPTARSPPSTACSPTTLLPKKQKQIQTHYKLQCLLYLFCSLPLSLYFSLSCHALPNMFAIIFTNFIANQLSCINIDKQLIIGLFNICSAHAIFFFICCALLPCCPPAFPYTHTDAVYLICLAPVTFCITAKSVKKKQTTYLQFMLK